MSTKDAPVKYRRGRMGADTRKLDAAIKAGNATTADLTAALGELVTLLKSGDDGDVLTGTTAGSFAEFVEPEGAEVIIAAAPNSAHDVSEITDVTIFSVSVPDVVAGDQIKAEVVFTLLNDSGAARTYTRRLEFGSFAQDAAEVATIADSSTGQSPRREFAVLSVSAANLARLDWTLFGQGTAAAGPAAGQVVTQNTGRLWNTTTSDLTGTITVAFKMRSSNANATQTLTLHSYKITKTPTT
jgi:hypothetical protein